MKLRKLLNKEHSLIQGIQFLDDDNLSIESLDYETQNNDVLRMKDELKNVQKKIILKLNEELKRRVK